MKQLILEALTLIFGNDYVSVLLIVGITFVACIISVLAILKHWGRFA